VAKGAAILHIEVQITPQYMQAGRVSDLSHGWKGRRTVLFFQFLVVGRSTLGPEKYSGQGRQHNYQVLFW
jgi:hypothetical protein